MRRFKDTELFQKIFSKILEQCYKFNLIDTIAKIKSKKVSKTDPESGWFHKGEHKSVFAYSMLVIKMGL